MLFPTDPTSLSGILRISTAKPYSEENTPSFSKANMVLHPGTKKPLPTFHQPIIHTVRPIPLPSPRRVPAPARLPRAEARARPFFLPISSPAKEALAYLPTCHRIPWHSDPSRVQKQPLRLRNLFLGQPVAHAPCPMKTTRRSENIEKAGLEKGDFRRHQSRQKKAMAFLDTTNKRRETSSDTS